MPVQNKNTKRGRSTTLNNEYLQIYVTSLSDDLFKPILITANNCETIISISENGMRRLHKSRLHSVVRGSLPDVHTGVLPGNPVWMNCFQ